MSLKSKGSLVFALHSGRKMQDSPRNAKRQQPGNNSQRNTAIYILLQVQLNSLHRDVAAEDHMHGIHTHPHAAHHKAEEDD